MRIAVLDDYQSVAERCADWSVLGPECQVDFLAEHIAEGERAARLAAYDVIVAMRERTPFPGHLLRQLPKLRLLVTTGPINRAIDVAAANELGIEVCGTRSDPLLAAELAWALMMALFKQVASNDHATRNGYWQPNMPLSLRGATLGLVGLGKLGQRMARFARAFDMEVIAWSPNLTAERCQPRQVRYVEKDALFAEADVVSIHMVLSAATRHLVQAAQLRQMKPGAVLVNTSRGGLVHEDALVQALTKGWIAGAALDVFDEEPLPADSRLLDVPNLLLSPHVGYMSWQNYRTYYGDAVEDIIAWRAGRPERVIKP